MFKNRMKWIAVLLIIGFVAATTAIANEQSITGTVEKTDQGVVISTESGDTYQVMGKDLSDMVGKTVKATGTLSEGTSGKALIVIQVEPVNE
jgi:hypothetical protein